MLVEDFGSAKIVTSWPLTVELQIPRLGYVNRPFNAVSFGDKGNISDADRHDNWRLIQRLEKGSAAAELYGRP